MNSLKLTPMHDRLIVKRSEEIEKTKGGIIIPDAVKEKPKEGVIVAAGPGKISEMGQLMPMSVKVGDNILFSQYAGSEIKIDDEDYLIIQASDVHAVRG